eukprot:TRINITY_DN38183_c0_g1_i1.p1 TRINITY_DN38183_c0_g1~~TRINITY_DN38183_c0_g1_i1.p1  ORF type:complete len:318 (+),score=72.71 TRINITY_DN38183_c0_g1_i1:86-1039(+)
MARAPARQDSVEQFRIFASQLAGQLVNQLCHEFEREVGCLWNDVGQYRVELERVADLLGEQLTREKHLHGMLDAVAEHHAGLEQQAHVAASNSPRMHHSQAQGIHELVDQLLGEHTMAMSSSLQGVSQARATAEAHARSAKQLLDPLVGAENELVRIKQLLAVPMISSVAPDTLRPPASPGQAQQQMGEPIAQVMQLQGHHRGPPPGSYVPSSCGGSVEVVHGPGVPAAHMHHPGMLPGLPQQQQQMPVHGVPLLVMGGSPHPAHLQAAQQHGMMPLQHQQQQQQQLGPLNPIQMPQLPSLLAPHMQPVVGGGLPSY